MTVFAALINSRVSDQNFLSVWKFCCVCFCYIVLITDTGNRLGVSVKEPDNQINLRIYFNSYAPHLWLWNWRS